MMDGTSASWREGGAITSGSSSVRGGGASGEAGGSGSSASGSSAKSTTIFVCSECSTTRSSSSPMPALFARAGASLAPSMRETMKASMSESAIAFFVNEATTMGTPFTSGGSAMMRVASADEASGAFDGWAEGSPRCGTSIIRRTTDTSVTEDGGFAGSLEGSRISSQLGHKKSSGETFSPHDGHLPLKRIWPRGGL